MGAGIGSGNRLPPYVDMQFLYEGFNVAETPYTFSQLISFTRTSAATYVNSAGNVVSASSGTPRFDYDPVTLQPRGLLIEEQRTNLLSRSEEFDNSDWSKDAATVTANATTSPDGTADADKLVEDISTGVHGLASAVPTTNAPHTMSVFFKAGTRQWVRMGNGSDAQFAWFDISTGAVGNLSAGVTATVADAGNGWFRCSCTFTPSISGGRTYQIQIGTANGVLSNVGDGTSGIFVWGAQLEAASFATSYIPTAGSQVTCAADQASIVAPNFAPWYNQSEGTFVVEAVTQKPTSLGATAIAIDASDGGINNRHYIGVVSASAEVRTVNGGSVQSLLTQAYTANVIEKYAYAMKANDFAFARNGSIVGTDTSGSMPTIDRMFIGNAAGSAEYFNGHIRRVTYYPSRLSNAQLQALSA